MIFKDNIDEAVALMRDNHFVLIVQTDAGPRILRKGTAYIKGPEFEAIEALARALDVR